MVYVILFIPLNINGDESSDLSAKRLETLRYGTDSEIKGLISTIEIEKIEEFDSEFVEIASKSSNQNLIEPILVYLGGRGISGLEDKASEIIKYRDEYRPTIVDAALNYSAAVYTEAAVDALYSILEAEETRFIEGALKALGKSADSELGPFLLSYYERNIDDTVKSRIIETLGIIKYTNASNFIVAIALDKDSKSTLRIAAAKALASIGEDEALSKLTALINDDDANLRVEIINALSQHTNSDHDSLIMEALRDSYYKARIAAARVCGERKISDAIPFLAYRSKYDEVSSVKQAALDALGAIGTNECFDVVADVFSDTKAIDSVRINAAKILISENPLSWLPKVKPILDSAKSDKRMVFYNGLAKLVSETKDENTKPYVEYFLVSNEIIDIHYALDIIILNSFTAYKDDVQKLSGHKNKSIAQKAEKALLSLSGDIDGMKE